MSEHLTPDMLQLEAVLQAGSFEHARVSHRILCFALYQLPNDASCEVVQVGARDADGMGAERRDLQQERNLRRRLHLPRGTSLQRCFHL